MSSDGSRLNSPNGVYETLGSWLEVFPPVPNWVQWVLVFSALGFPFILYLWRRWGVDIWAAKSAERAEKQSKKLANRVLNTHMISKNQNRLIVHGFIALVPLLMSLAFLGIAVSMGMHKYAPGADGLDPSSEIILARKAAFWLTISVAYYMLYRTTTKFRTLVDVARLPEFAMKSRDRMVALFDKANVSKDLQNKRLKIVDDLLEQINNSEKP